MSTGTRTRPNANPILCLMRDDDIAGDPWGTAMAWAFGVAEVLDAAGEDVPQELGFQRSPYVAPADPDVCPDQYPDAMVWDALNTWGMATVAELQTAGRCLHRYIDWCRAAGRDY